MSPIPISGVGSVASVVSGAQSGAASAAAQEPFDLAKLAGKGVNAVNNEINQANKVTEEFLTHGKHQLHEVMISLEQADLSFRYMTQIRNKVIDAYNDIIRMQV